eukprot:1762477-Pleurochrysis_carterae.AAC.2
MAPAGCRPAAAPPWLTTRTWSVDRNVPSVPGYKYHTVMVEPCSPLVVEPRSPRLVEPCWPRVVEPRSPRVVEAASRSLARREWSSLARHAEWRSLAGTHQQKAVLKQLTANASACI